MPEGSAAAHALRCRNAFQSVCVHANGEVVCSIIDGRGDFVVGNVHEQSLSDILGGSRARELRALVRSTADSYCCAIGKACPLKTIPVAADEDVDTTLRYLVIEPSTACDLKCLACPVRDFKPSVTWTDAYHDGGVRFLVWDGLRRTKQHVADGVRRTLPALDRPPSDLGRTAALLLRGRIRSSRTGTLPLDVVKRVVDEAGPAVERVDFYNYGEPFLYRYLVDALRHVRAALPAATIAISTDGMQVREDVEKTIVNERLLDWLIFSVDGCDAESYSRYRIGGTFNIAFANLRRFHECARGSGMHVVWQYVVFEWNDSDAQLRRAIEMATGAGLTLWFDFANTWGRSRRRAQELRFVAPYLKPFTALPGEPRLDGW
jgi:pyruvate-formate lyase-activating enzyme